MEKLLRYPHLVAGIIAAITVFFGLQIPRVQLDNNNMRFLPEENHARVTANYIDETFGGQLMILVGLERPFQTVFESEFLARIREFSEAVETVKFVDDVNSIMSTQYITGDDESIIVTNLVPDDFSGSREEIAELQRRIASWDLYQGALVSNDLSATQILVNLAVITENATSPEVTQIIIRIREMAHEFFEDMAEVYITGQTVINLNINEAIIADLPILFPLIVIVLLTVLFFSFRRFTFVVLPLLTVVIAAVWTVGMASLLGIKFSIITTIMPVILLAVGSAYGIHLVTHYLKDTRELTFTVEEHRTLVFNLVRKLVKPVFLAALTTLACFFSFVFAPIVPIKEFGICASIGVIAAFSIAILFIPSMLLIRGPRLFKSRQKEQTGEDRFSAAVASFFPRIVEKKVAVLVITVMAAGFFVYGISKVIVDNVLVEYFKDETDISRSDYFIREFFGGSKDLSLVIEADTTEELLHPRVLTAVDNLTAFLNRHPEVGKVLGFTDIVKRVNQVFNVGESPAGLRPRLQTTSFFDDTDSFGFGDFGFDYSGFASPAENFSTASPETTHDIALYTVEDLISLLDTAAGRSPDLSGHALVRELQRLTNHEGMAYYEIPSEPQRYGMNTPEELQMLVSNYLVLLAGADNSGYSNDPLEPTAIRTLIQLRTTGNNDTNAVIDTINSFITANFPSNVRTMIGGGAVLEGAVTDLIVNSSIISISLSVLIIFLIVAISNRSLVAGIIGAVPLALAILSNFAIMGLAGIKLNMGTALVGSLTVGIGIDYTIHFIEFFKLEYRANRKDFLRRAYMGCGKAIIINALSVGAGFWVLLFSRFRIISELGLITGLSMLITGFISLTIVPVLLTVIKPKFVYAE
jgi:predicted RND superfamily exporter protein